MEEKRVRNRKMGAKRFTQTDLDIRELNSTLNNMQKWMAQHQKMNDQTDLKVENLELSNAKQGTINAILGFVSGAIVVSIITLLVTKVW